GLLRQPGEGHASHAFHACGNEFPNDFNGERRGCDRLPHLDPFMFKRTIFLSLIVTLGLDPRVLVLGCMANALGSSPRLTIGGWGWCRCPRMHPSLKLSS